MAWVLSLSRRRNSGNLLSVPAAQHVILGLFGFDFPAWSVVSFSASCSLALV
jgi:hypothetical protein